MILISSGHGEFVRGASDLIDEVTEARRVVDRVGEILSVASIPHKTFHENSARNATHNVNNIVGWHNSLQSDLCVSVHFNAVGGGTREAGIGVETLYLENSLPCRGAAESVSRAISEASGLILRRFNGTLPSRYGFLRLIRTSSILIEVCFVNSRTDVRLYQENFNAICHAIAEAISGKDVEEMTQDRFDELMNDYLKRLRAKPASPWATKPTEGSPNGLLQAARDAGITDGTRPRSFATREEVAVMINSAVNK